MYDLENTFSCKTEMNLLEKEFDEFIKEQGLTKKLDTLTLLKQIKIFLANTRPNRKRAFSKTKLRNADCITRSIITQMLAARKGLQVKIAYPKQLRKFIHTAILYPHNGKLKLFEVAGGKTLSTNLKVLTEKQVVRRLKLTYPIFRIPLPKTQSRRR